MEQFISDHTAVCFNLNLRKPLNERRTVISRKLKGFDFDAFNEMIGSSGLSDGCISQSIESLAKEYDEVLCKALDKLKELALLSFDLMLLGIIRIRSLFRRRKGEGSNVNGVRLVLKLTG